MNNLCHSNFNMNDSFLANVCKKTSKSDLGVKRHPEVYFRVCSWARDWNFTALGGYIYIYNVQWSKHSTIEYKLVDIYIYIYYIYIYIIYIYLIYVWYKIGCGQQFRWPPPWPQSVRSLRSLRSRRRRAQVSEGERASEGHVTIGGEVHREWTPKLEVPSKCIKHNWMVVSTPLKNISQLGWLFPIYGKIKHVPNHQPDNIYTRNLYMYVYV